MKNHIQGKKISAYADGELLPEERKKIALHISQCGKCKKLLKNSRQINHLFTQNKQKILTPPFLEKKILNSLKAKKTKASSKSSFIRLRPSFQFIFFSLFLMGFVFGLFLGNELSPLLLYNKTDSEIVVDFFQQDLSPYTPLAEFTLGFIENGDAS